MTLIKSSTDDVLVVSEGNDIPIDEDSDERLHRQEDDKLNGNSGRDLLKEDNGVDWLIGGEYADQSVLSESYS